MVKGVRGQAAMEFLMTYGWAILVVLVVIGALAYFGVLNPDTLLPEKCTLPVGLSCTDHKVTKKDSFTITMQNGLGRDVRIYEINLSGDAITGAGVSGAGVIMSYKGNQSMGPGTCALNNTWGGESANNASILRSGSAATYSFGCNYSDTGRTKNRYKVKVVYSALDSGTKRTFEGELLAKAEAE